MNKRWVIGLSLVLLASQGSSATAGVPSVVASADSEGTNQITAFGSEGDDLVADSMASAAAPATDMPLWRTNPAQAYPTATTRLVGDVTGDGRDDVVGFEVGIFVIPGGDAAPGPMVTYDPGLWVEDGVIGDINGDGIADVIAKQPTALQIYPGGISGGLGSRVTYSVGTVTAVDVLDANGDGRDDIAYLTPSGLSFLVQTPSGTLDAVDYPQAPDPGGHEDFTTGDFDGDGRVDFITWPGVLSFDPVGGPRIYLQTAPEVWVEAGAIAMEDSDHRVWTVGAFDLDGDGATEIVVSVMVMGAPDRYARLYWQEPGHLNTTDSTVAACREPHLAFSDADRNGLTDMACRGDAGIVLYRQIAERVFEQNFYLHLDGKSSSPLIGDFFGDSNPDLATTYIDGSFSARLYAGVSPGALGADLAVIRGAMETVDGLLDDICVEAISAHTGAILAETVSTAGGYRLDVPEGIYVLRMRDCRPHPRSPAGMSFLAHIWGGSSPVLVVATSESDRNVDLYTELQDDMTGTIVDDVSGEPLGGIRIWEGIKDWRISGHYWIANSTETDTSGSFTRYGSYRQIEVFVDDPLEVYPPHTLYVHSDPGDLGVLGLVDPIMRDIRDSVFLADILWLRAAGVTRGCNPPVNDRFCTNDLVTRGQMAAFLVRFLDLTRTGGVKFVDDDDSIFQADIEALADAGITKGCNPPVNDRFCPNDYVTRKQMAAFLTRALDLRNVGTVEFVDDDGLIFEESIERLAAAGITRGCNPPVNDRFCPHSFVTRGQMAAFLQRSSDLRS